MVDATFFSKSSVSSESDVMEEIQQEIVVPETPVVPETKPEEDKEVEKEEVLEVKEYKNSYLCLKDAFAVFDNCKYYSYTSVMQGESLNQVQMVKNFNYYSDGLFSTEAYAYSDSSFGSSLTA